jgi:hypothetical protein
LRRVIGAIRPPGTSADASSATTAPKSVALVYADPVYPPSPFEDWTFEKIATAVEDRFDAQTIDASAAMADVLKPAPGSPTYQGTPSSTNPVLVNRAFYKGDHWQNGYGWIGPHPATTDTGFQKGMQEIYLIFTSKNVIKEGTNRHVNGVAGKPVDWSYIPKRDLKEGEKTTPEEDKLIDEATQMVRLWLYLRKVPTFVRETITTVLLSERSATRMMIPPGLASPAGDGTFKLSAPTVHDALRYIFLEHPLPEHACIITDPDTQSQAAIWTYSAVPKDGTEEKEHAAIAFVNEKGETVTRIFTEEDKESPAAEAAIPMGGQLPMFEMKREALITVQVQQAQRALNLAESMIPRTAVTSGFMERLLIDLQSPADPEVIDGIETGRWIPRPFYTGAGTTNFLQSSEYLDEEGRMQRASGSAHYKDPVAADGPIKASDKHYKAILEEIGQIHALISGDATASAISRITARIEYLGTLWLTSGEVEAQMRFILDTVLLLAEAIANKPGLYTSVIKGSAQCRLDVGPISAEERTALEASIGKTMSQETAMKILGVDDVDGEKSKMASDPLARAGLGLQIGLALAELTAAGATIEGAARFLGMDEDLITDLLTGAQDAANAAAAASAAALGNGGPPKPGTPPKTPGAPAPTIPAP